MRVAVTVATLALSALVAPAASAGTRAPIPPILPPAHGVHFCVPFEEDWQELNPETGTIVYGNAYAVEWWGHGGICTRAEHIAAAGIAGADSTPSGDITCNSSQDGGGVQITPVANVACFVTRGRIKHGWRVAYRVLAVADARSIKHWKSGDPECGQEDHEPCGGEGAPGFL